MLPYGSLKLSSFFKFFPFCCSSWVFILSCLPGRWSVLLRPLTCLCFPWVYFSFELLYSSALIFFFFIFSKSLLKFSLCSHILLPEGQWASLWPLLWSLCHIDGISLFYSFSQVLFCSFVWNIFLCLLVLLDSLCFYALSRSVMSSGLEGVALRRRHRVEPRSAVSPGDQIQMLWTRPMQGLGTPCCGWTVTIVGTLVGGAGPRHIGLLCQLWLLRVQWWAGPLPTWLGLETRLWLLWVHW